MFYLKTFFIGPVFFSTLSHSLKLPRDDPDGASGDGGCDPCLDSCEDNTRSAAAIPRMIFANDSSPWEAGETSRWVMSEKVDGLVKRTEFNLQFNCDSIPDVCNNMCYGAMCQGRGFDLTIQRDNVQQCQAARKQNSCGSTNPNYCSQKSGFTAGFSCDEYPFASTKEGQTGTPTATRCVPKGENSSQGGTISGLYRNGQGTGRLADGTTFTVALINQAGLTNCENYPAGPPNCDKDDNDSGNSQRP